MKILKLVSIFILLASFANAQTAYNPFTQNIHFEPEPTVAGFGCGTMQTVAFTQGLTTAADATQFSTNPLVVTICITGFTFPSTNASSIVSGSYASNFTWSFDPFAPNCLIGTQSAILPGTGTDPLFPNPAASGDIKVDLLVPELSPISTVLAVNVNLQVPGYMATFNSTPDDNESTQTQTFCDLKIKGTIFNDITILDENVNGTPINDPDGTPLYANLVGPNGTVVGTTLVNSNGTYEFTNVTPNTIYTVVLSTTSGTVGNPAPTPSLPGTWINVGEDCCDGAGVDGTANGIVTVAVTNASQINADFGIFNPTPTGPLPVTIKSFEVSEYNCSALLSWTTQEEKNTSHIEIYRKDGSSASYEKLATVAAAGNSSVEKLYTFYDKSVEKTTEPYLYRLKFVDIDQKSSYSEEKSLKLNCSNEQSGVQLFPNPANNEINLVYLTESDDVQLMIDVMDVTGRKVLSTSKIINNGTSIIKLDVASLANGHYMVRYYSVEERITGAIKFTKK